MPCRRVYRPLVSLHYDQKKYDSSFLWDVSHQDDSDYPKGVIGIAYIRDYGDSYRLEIFTNGEHTVLDGQLVELE